MEVTLLNLLEGLEKTYLAVTIRQSAWMYPWLEILHISGIVLLVGAAFLFDLRLLGFSKNIPVTALVDYLINWSRKGLWIVIPTGILLFTCNAKTLGYDPVFWIKIGLIILAGLNAERFHRYILTGVSSWNQHVDTPVSAKLSAIFSMTAWFAVIACGRLLAY